MAKNLLPSLKQLRMLGVNAPVPGPNSAATRISRQGNQETISRASQRELGAIAPTAIGCRANWVTNLSDWRNGKTIRPQGREVAL